MAMKDYAESEARGQPDHGDALSFGDLTSAYPEMRRAVVAGLVRQGETVNIIAPPKAGKSWLTYSLAGAVVTGDPWLGKYSCVQGDVLLIDNELHPETIGHRLWTVARAMGAEAESAFRDRLRIKCFRGKLLDVRGIAGWLERFEPGRFALVIIDALYRAMPRGMDENSNRDVTELYNVIDAAADRLRCAVANVHHATKGNQAGKSVTDVGSGGGAQSRAADTHLILRPHEDQHLAVVEAVTRSWPPVAPFCVRWEYPLWSAEYDADPTLLKREKLARGPSGNQQAALRQNKEKVLAVFSDGQPRTKNAVRDSTGISGYTATAVLNALLKDGCLEECDVQTKRGPFPGFRAATPDNPGRPRTNGKPSDVVHRGPRTADNP
jgi:hypothetical protein